MTPHDSLAGRREFLVLFALGLALFLPAALQAEFLNFDDDFFFGAQNAAFVDGGLAHVLDPTATIANAYLPVAHASLYLDYSLFGANPIGPHVHSLLLHIVAAFVLARLIGRFGVDRALATLAAAVFLVHPALVESVAWVASRKDVLSGLFTFLCLASVTRASRGESGQSKFAVVYAVLALYSKSTTVVLPILAALIVCAARPRKLGLVAALFGLTLAIGLHHTWIASSEGTLVTDGLAARGAQVPGVYWHYFATTLWPARLNVMYPEVLTHEWFRAHVLAGWVALVALAGIVVAARRSKPLLAFGVFAWFVALLPFNTALPASAAAAADRYLYLAVPAAAVALAGLGPGLGRVALGVALLFGIIGTWQRVDDFGSSEALWAASIEAEPRNAVAHYNLALAVLTRDPTALEEAERSLAAAVESARLPQHRLHAEMQLAVLCESDGRVDAAVEHAANAVAAIDELGDGPAVVQKRLQVLLKAARQARLVGDVERSNAWIDRARGLGPDDPEVLAFAASAKLGSLLGAEGRVAADHPGLAEVRALIERAAASVTSRPPYVLPLVRAELAAALGESMAATKFYRRAIELDARRCEAHLGLAQLFLSRGLYQGANDVVDFATAAGVRDPRLQYLRGFALGGLGRLDDARRYYEYYLLGRPHDPAARRALAGVLASQAMRDLYRATPEQLERAVTKILQYDPDNAKVAVIQGVVARHRRDMQGALVMFEKALARLGDDLEVRRLLVETLRDRGYELLLDGERHDAALTCFRRAIELSPGTSVTVTSMENIVREDWERRYQAARDALVAKDYEAAERGLRECLELRPDDPQPRLQLGFVHYLRGGEELESALREFRGYIAGQRGRGRDPTVGVLYEVQTLRRLERLDDALGVADAFLGKPAASADEANLQRIRDVRADVAERLHR